MVQTDSRTFEKVYEHVTTFNHFKNKEMVKDVKFSLMEKGIEPFEAIQLLNLCPENVEEAKTLIPR